LTHFFPDGQEPQVAPLLPQAVSLVPAWHMPLLSQQPPQALAQAEDGFELEQSEATTRRSSAGITRTHENGSRCPRHLSRMIVLR
jgi:hypothetical protein